MFHGERAPEIETSDRHDEAPGPMQDPAAATGSSAAFVAQAISLGVTAGLALEVGCGSGRRAILLAARAPGLRIVGVDASAALIARARDAARRAGLSGRCTFLRGDPKRLPLRSRVFDLVICDGLLHHLAAALPAINEAARVAAAPGGAIFIRDLGRPARFALALSAAWRTIRSPAAGHDALLASQRAAFTVAELADLLRRSHLRGARVVRLGRRHLGIVRRAGEISRTSP